jgi:hypothetical protein
MPGFLKRTCIAVYKAARLKFDKEGRLVSFYGIGTEGQLTKAYIKPLVVFAFMTASCSGASGARIVIRRSLPRSVTYQGGRAQGGGGGGRECSCAGEKLA